MSVRGPKRPRRMTSGNYKPPICEWRQMLDATCKGKTDSDEIDVTNWEEITEKYIEDIKDEGWTGDEIAETIAIDFIAALSLYLVEQNKYNKTNEGRMEKMKRLVKEKDE